MKTSICLALAIVGLFSGCDSGRLPPESPDTLAAVGSKEIRVADLRSESARRESAGLPVLSKEQLLEELVNREALLAEALRAGLDRETSFRRSWENMLIGRLKERELRPQLEQASVPAEVVDAPRVDGVAAPRKMQLHLAILQLSTGRRASDQRRADQLARMNEARKLALQLPAGEPGFGPLAIHYSDDQVSRYQGGDHGWVVVEEAGSNLPDEVLKAAQALGEVGTLSDVIVTERGVFLARLLGRRSPGDMSRERQDPARHKLRLREERQRIEQTFLARIRERSGVTLRPEALVAVELESPPISARLDAEPPSLP